MDIRIGKKNGSVESFDEAKVERAIRLASDRIGRKLNPVEVRRVIGLIEDEITQTFVHVSEMHKIVCRVLKETYPDVAQSYQNFRDYKLTYVKDLEKLFEESKNTLKYGDRENANFDSALISTKGSLLRGYLTKLLYTKYYLHKDEAEATRLGTIYIHDMRDMVMQSINCCLFDIGEILKGGFEMANIRYKEPNSVLSALQVAGDVTLSASAQEFGGFTLAELDRVLVPYAKKTMENARAEFDSFMEGTAEQREKYAWHKLERELEQGFQSLELKLNTVPSSRGDFAFTTMKDVVVGIKLGERD